MSRPEAHPLSTCVSANDVVPESYEDFIKKPVFEGFDLDKATALMIKAGDKADGYTGPTNEWSSTLVSGSFMDRYMKTKTSASNVLYSPWTQYEWRHKVSRVEPTSRRGQPPVAGCKPKSESLPKDPQPPMNFDLTVTTEVKPVKRGRGRPRKYPKPAEPPVKPAPIVKPAPTVKPPPTPKPKFPKTNRKAYSKMVVRAQARAEYAARHRELAKVEKILRARVQQEAIEMFRRAQRVQDGPKMKDTEQSCSVQFTDTSATAKAVREYFKIEETVSAQPKAKDLKPAPIPGMKEDAQNAFWSEPFEASKFEIPFKSKPAVETKVSDPVSYWCDD